MQSVFFLLKMYIILDSVELSFYFTLAQLKRTMKNKVLLLRAALCSGYKVRELLDMVSGYTKEETRSFLRAVILSASMRNRERLP